MDAMPPPDGPSTPPEESATEPETAPQPVVAWAPPPVAEPLTGSASGAPTGALFGGRDRASLTLGDALSTGFSILAKPAFILPVLVVGVAVNAVLGALLRPFLSTPTFTAGQAITAAEFQQFAGGILAAVVVGIIGGVLINLYGQVWAVAASSGPLPTIGETFALVGKRWVGVIGTGLTVAVIEIALLLLGLALVAVIGLAVSDRVGIVVALVLIVVYFWIALRLLMAGWLAADGNGVSASVNGSWRMTKGSLLRIAGWSIAFGLVFGIIGAILGVVLGLVPVIGTGIAQTIGVGLGYGAGVTLYRRTQAASTARPGPEVAAPIPG